MESDERPARKRRRTESSLCSHGSVGSAQQPAYKAPTYDFQLLAREHPPLRPLNGAVGVNWKDPHAVRELTCAILKQDYDIQLELPINQLCPPVPNRANYIHWLHDLISHNSPQLVPPIRGVDIGTGASCIYPLLGAKIGGWRFVATDIDKVSLLHAQHNVSLNKLDASIELRLTSPESILSEAVRTGEQYAFSMCNPPFFAELQEACQNPRTVCMGTLNELVTAGGEVRFVERMIEESLQLGASVRWYTSMIGKKQDLKALLSILKSKGIVNVRTATFSQGKTTRWALAWSLTHDGLESRARMKAVDTLRGRNEICFAVSVSLPSELLKYLHNLFESLKLTLRTTSDPYCFYAKANTNTWQSPTIDREATAREVSHSPESLLFQELKELQSYAEHYEQVIKALADDPANPDLLELKGHLEEVLSLAHHLQSDLNPRETESQAGESESLKTIRADDKWSGALDNREIASGASTIADSHFESSESERTKADFEVQVQVMQEQGSIFMVRFSWAGGDRSSKRDFDELLDYLKRSLTARFPRA